MKVNYVAFPFRQADDLVTNLENPEGYGWDADKKVIWSDISYSDEMNELLLFEERKESDCDKPEDDVDVKIEDNSGF